MNVLESGNTLDKSLRRALKAKRKEKGLTMRQLSVLLNIPHSLVGHVESGERRLTPGELDLYCKPLGTDLISLVHECKETNKRLH